MRLAIALACLLFAQGVVSPTAWAQGSVSCDQLWQARNEIHARKGFCFQSERAVAAFGRGCFPPFGRLTDSEKREVAAIEKLENFKGCSLPAPAVVGRPKIDVPVIAGELGPEADACQGTGEVVGLDPRGDGFLSVRSGPGGSPYREIDRVFNGQPLYLCSQKGPWFGVVYHRGNGELDCGVMSTWHTRQPYTGPCSFGWVHSRYVRIIAG